MARTTNDIIEPFTVGQSLTNGNSAIANYNVFIIVLQEPSTGTGNNKCACVYNRGMGAQNYGMVSHNSSYEYWHWFQINLSGNTFSAVGASDFGSSGSAGGVKYGSVLFAAIYGIC